MPSASAPLGRDSASVCRDELGPVERLLLLHGASLDLRHVIATVREFADALEDPGRIEALDRLLKKTGLRA